MALKELTIEGEVDRVQVAIERLKTFEPPKGYYLAFSGGKDSQCIYELAKMSGVKFDAHYRNTTVDPPELVRFIKDNYPDVDIERPSKGMFALIRKNGMPPTRVIRYCCRALKEAGNKNRTIVTGNRWQESWRRSKRKMTEVCMSDSTKIFLHPIIDWSEQDVWEFIKVVRNIPYCTLYDEGYKRLGCIMCPQGGKRKMLFDAKRYPKFYKAYLKAFDDIIKSGKWKKSKTAQEVMDWWIHEPSKQLQDTLFN